MTTLVVLSACASAPKAAPPPTQAPRPANSLGKLDLVLRHFQSPGEANLGALSGKVVLVDFWATWCGPCHAAARAYERIYTQYHPQGLEVFGVSVDDDGAPIAQFVADQGVSYPILLDPEAAVSGPRFDIGSVPYTVIADRQGQVRFTHEGFEAGSEGQIQQEIQQLLAEK